MYQKILDSLPFYVFIFTKDGKYIDAYGGLNGKGRIDARSYIGRSLYDVAPKEIATEFHKCVVAAINENKTQTLKYKYDLVKDRVLHPEQEAIRELWFEGVVTPLGDDSYGEPVAVWTAKEITMQHEFEQKLKELSQIDCLTGVLNRRYFEEKYRIHLDQGSSSEFGSALIMLDLDWFKVINDTMGHACGDEVLKHAARILTEETKSIGIVGRVGGEEFAILIKDTTPKEAMLVAEKIRIRIEGEPFSRGLQPIKLTVSIGVTMIDDGEEELSVGMHRADMALYNSKRQGRNRSTYM
ncbi:TPA: GGDEF domain-containing protein [Vibrio vulnificus]|uniref:diguanylate cyclase n=1 Tax=Vibrio vulnificus TaxID=672 RepID=A0A8H9MVD3_VIBVL|nr:GGDEF domain-containing protein [Vibrio vulnificus]HAS8538272.1 GGDEF domain-containing protein [Vibrio vulnificus]